MSSYEDLYAEILAGIEAPLPPACKSTRFCEMAGGCSLCQLPKHKHPDLPAIVQKMREQGYITTPPSTNDGLLGLALEMGADPRWLTAPYAESDEL